MSEILFPTGVGGGSEPKWILAVIQASNAFGTIYVRDSSGVTSEYTANANGQVFVDMQVGSTYYITDSFETDIEYTCDGSEADTPITLFYYYTQSVDYTMLLDTTSGTLDECTDVTGGWDLTGYIYGYGQTFQYSTPTKDNNGIHCPALTNGNIYAFGLNNALDYTDYNLFLMIAGGTQGRVDANTIKEFKWGSAQAGPTTCIGTFDYTKTSAVTRKAFSFNLPESRSSLYLGFGCGTVAGRTLNLHNCAVVKPNNYEVDVITSGGVIVADTDQLLQSYEVLSSLLSSREWVEHILCKKLTGDFMAKAVQSQTFLDALDAAPAECYNLVVTNPHWSKFLKMVGWIPSIAMVYLYKDGTFVEEYSNTAWQPSKWGNTAKAPALTINSTNFKLTQSSYSNAGTLFFNKNINPELYQSLHCEFSGVNASSSIRIGLVNTRTANFDDSYQKTLTSGETTYSKNMSGINLSESYFGITMGHSYNDTSTPTIIVSRIWLIPKITDYPLK